jgi:hypothetical protein
MFESWDKVRVVRAGEEVDSVNAMMESVLVRRCRMCARKKRPGVEFEVE